MSIEQQKRKIFVENLYNLLSVYNSLSAAIHLHIIRPLLSPSDPLPLAEERSERGK